jgi:peptidoglycan LD-endopeptidase LytH
MARTAPNPEKRRSWRTAGAVLGGFVLGAGTVLLVLWLYNWSSLPPAAGPAVIPSGPESPPDAAPAAPRPQPTVPAPGPAPAAPPTAAAPPPGPISAPALDLARRRLIVPVAGIRPENLANTFDDARGTERQHEAMDIIAPRNTPVLAVEGGRIAKLFTSALGGLTIYQFDPSETYSYYYAHLEDYAPGLREGMTVRQGDLLGYVGTTGNAGPDNPHLHFAIFQLGPEKSWWRGTPINPYPLLRNQGG